MNEKVIGVFPVFNTGGICVHTIDEAEERVLASTLRYGSGGLLHRTLRQCQKHRV